MIDRRTFLKTAIISPSLIVSTIPNSYIKVNVIYSPTVSLIRDDREKLQLNWKTNKTITESYIFKKFTETKIREKERPVVFLFKHGSDCSLLLFTSRHKKWIEHIQKEYMFRIQTEYILEK